MLRQYRETDRLINDVRSARVNVGQDERLSIGEIERSQIRAPVHDGGELAG